MLQHLRNLPVCRRLRHPGPRGHTTHREWGSTTAITAAAVAAGRRGNLRRRAVSFASAVVSGIAAVRIVFLFSPAKVAVTVRAAVRRPSVSVRHDGREIGVVRGRVAGVTKAMTMALA